MYSFDRCHKFDQKILLREQPLEKLDFRLWQTFRNINLQITLK